MEPSADRPTVRRLIARPWRLAAVGLLVMMLAMALAPGTAGAASPYDVGPSRVYFPQTGHYLAYGFLDYWHHNGDVAVFGYPITEELRDPATGLTIQYFERAVFEWHPTAARNWQVQLRRLGTDLTAGRVSLAPFQPVSAQTDANCTFYPQTGHRLCFGFRYFWHTSGDLAVFGYPISEEFVENGLTVQYFERARLEYHPELKGTPYEVEIGLLGTQAAVRDAVNRAPVAQSNATPTYEPGLWYLPEPVGAREVRTPPPGAPTDQAKWIEIDLADQYVRVWEYDQLVYGSWASTGVAAHPTPTGRFEIVAKLPTDDLTGGTASTNTAQSLPAVPNVMNFWDGYAIVGGSWLSSFGSPATNGSVALPLEAAHWIYDWTPYGTAVWIHQ